MKKILLTLTLTVAFSVSVLTLSAGTGTSYAIKVIKDNKVVAEMNIKSRALLDDAVEKLSEKFPNADRIEIETANDTIAL